MIGARTRCLWGENLCATSSTFAGRCHMIGKVVTGCVAILPYHTATQDRGSECRDFGFISRIVTALQNILFNISHYIFQYIHIYFCFIRKVCSTWSGAAQNDQCITSKYRESNKRADGSLSFRIALAVLWCHTLIILRTAASSQTHLLSVDHMIEKASWKLSGRLLLEWVLDSGTLIRVGLKTNLIIGSLTSLSHFSTLNFFHGTGDHMEISANFQGGQMMT